MKPLYINFNKPKSVMSNITFNEHKMFEAHTSDQPGYEMYVSVKQVNKYIEVLRRIAVDNLSAVDCERLAKDVLGES